jgi:hypothetical protein
VQHTARRTVSIHLAPSPSPSPSPSPPPLSTLVSATIFSSFRNRLSGGARTMVFSIVRPGVPRENAPIVHDQTAAAVTARFLRSLRIISRELLSREESSSSSSSGGGVFTAKPPPRGIYCHWFASGCISRKQIRRDVVINPFSLESYLNTGIRAAAAKIILLQVYVKSARTSYTHVCGLGKRTHCESV